MSRRAKLFIMIALFGISFVTLGKAPRMPEPRGQATIEMTAREGSTRYEDAI